MPRSSDYRLIPTPADFRDWFRIFEKQNRLGEDGSAWEPGEIGKLPWCFGHSLLQREPRPAQCEGIVQRSYAFQHNDGSLFSEG
jgi:hypothetical protein